MITGLNDTAGWLMNMMATTLARMRYLHVENSNERRLINTAKLVVRGDYVLTDILNKHGMTATANLSNKHRIFINRHVRLLRRDTENMWQYIKLEWQYCATVISVSQDTAA